MRDEEAFQYYKERALKELQKLMKEEENNRAMFIRATSTACNARDGKL